MNPLIRRVVAAICLFVDLSSTAIASDGTAGASGIGLCTPVMNDTVVVFIVALATLVGLFLVLNYRSSIEAQRTVRTTIEKGTKLTTDDVRLILGRVPLRLRDTRRAVLALAVSGGFFAVALLVRDTASSLPLLGIGIFFGVIGAAYIVLSWYFSDAS